MKNRMYFNLIAIVSLCLVAASCSTDDNVNVVANSQNIAQLESTVEAGTWRITNYNDSGQNETSDYSGYNFTFVSDGTLEATNGTVTIIGTWSIADDSNSSSDDDSQDDDIDFNIFFPVSDASDFEDLNDDWDIVSSTSTRIELIDISGGDGTTDRLTFEKN